jgi:hypothetical protein
MRTRRKNENRSDWWFARRHANRLHALFTEELAVRPRCIEMTKARTVKTTAIQNRRAPQPSRTTRRRWLCREANQRGPEVYYG